MFYDSDLRFLKDTLGKSHLRLMLIAPDRFAEEICGSGIEAAIGIAPETKYYEKLLTKSLAHGTMYKATDAFGLRYIYFLLPGHRDQILLTIGPYLTETPPEEWIFGIAEEYGIAPGRQKYLKEYFIGIPTIPDSSPILYMIGTFCEHIWQSPSFSVVDVNADDKALLPRREEDLGEGSYDDIMLNIKALEQRYTFENEMIEAVKHGQVHKDTEMLSAFSSEMFEKRSQDPLRNAKNYAVIMNTILRKAAESGGVHPIYIDRLSSEFAHRIEAIESLSGNTELMSDMFRAYCRLVRKHSMSSYSPVVQKTILAIDSDLSADLAPSTLAEHQNISAGYLSAVFKRETGQTLTEYIRKRRIKHAEHLLGSTTLQIQTVALHCGIMDVQYFSKIFKKEKGMTPKEYRESIK